MPNHCPPFGPPPRPTAISARHWAAGADLVLAVQQCTACSRYVFNPAAVCPYCTGADLVWTESPGLGTIHSFTVIHRAPVPTTPTPYVVAVIELDEGWHMLSNIVDVPVDEVRIGMRVQAAFVDLSNAVSLPVFRPLTTAHTA